MAKKQAKMKNKATYAKKSKKQTKQVARNKSKQKNKKVNQVKNNKVSEKKEELVVQQEAPVSLDIQEDIKEEPKVVETPTVVEEKEAVTKQEEIIQTEIKQESVEKSNDDETKQLSLKEIDTLNEVSEPEESTEHQNLEKTNLIDLFTKPKKYIQALSYDGSSGHILSLLVKHGIAVIGIVMYLTHTLNESGFSVARLNFTQSCSVWVRVALFLFLAEVIATILFVIIKEKKWNTKKMSELFYYSRKTSLVFVILLNLLGLAYYVSGVIGFIVLIIVLGILVNIRMAILNQVFNVRKEEMIKDIVILYLLFVITFVIFANLFLNDLSVIFQALN